MGKTGSLFMLLSLVLIASASAHELTNENENLRRIHSVGDYQWKLSNKAKLSGTYSHANYYQSDRKRRGKRAGRNSLKRICKTQFEAVPVDAPQSRLRRIGEYHPVDGSGYFRLEVSALKCQLENGDGQANFAMTRGAPNQARIRANNPNDSAAYNRLKMQLDKYTQWSVAKYALHVQTKGNSRFYVYNGSWRDGALEVDTGLFSGAFVNFPMTDSSQQQPDSWIQGITNLQIPQPMFMREDEVFGPNRVPAPVDIAEVSVTRKAKGAKQFSSHQEYLWEDSNIGGTGAERVDARFTMGPTPEFGFVHEADWQGIIKYQRKTKNEQRNFERKIEKHLHFELNQE